MLIVNKLLFKPMLGIMDERHAKIEAAAKKKADIENSRLKYENKLREAAENARKAASDRAVRRKRKGSRGREERRRN